MGEPQIAKGVSSRTLAYGPGGAKDRSLWNAVNAIANRAQQMARARRNSLTWEQRERIRRAGESMVNRVLSGL